MSPLFSFFLSLFSSLSSLSLVCSLFLFLYDLSSLWHSFLSYLLYFPALSSSSFVSFQRSGSATAFALAPPTTLLGLNLALCQLTEISKEIVSTHLSFLQLTTQQHVDCKKAYETRVFLPLVDASFSLLNFLVNAPPAVSTPPSGLQRSPQHTLLGKFLCRERMKRKQQREPVLPLHSLSSYFRQRCHHVSLSVSFLSLLCSPDLLRVLLLSFSCSFYLFRSFTSSWLACLPRLSFPVVL